LSYVVWEIFDNALCEFLAGHCTKIKLTINEDSSVTIEDDGRGIPTGISPKTGQNFLQGIFTALRSGSGCGFKISGGLYGIGAAVVNALSERMEVVVCRNGKIHRQVFERGNPTNDLEILGDTDQRGTKVTFLPDHTIFFYLDKEARRVPIEVQWDDLTTRASEMAFLNKGLTIELKNRRDGGQSVTYFYEHGIVDYVEHIKNSRTPIHAPPIYFAQESDTIVLQCALQWTDGNAESINTFANNTRTDDGGTHLDGFNIALTSVINHFARRLNALHENDANLTNEDVRRGLTAVVAATIPEPQFEGETLERLGNPEVETIASTIVSQGLTACLERHPTAANAIVLHVVQRRLTVRN
jgi:DNA gyrase subunit B